MPVDVALAHQALSDSGGLGGLFGGSVADVGAWAMDAGERLMAAIITLLSPLLVDEIAGKPAWMWWSFIGVVAALLAFDLGVMNRRARDLRAIESLLLSAFYVAVAMAFGAWMWWAIGRDSAIAFLAGFLVEKSLAVDNVFVMFLIFGALAIPRHLHQAVLFWGILGVIALRLGLLVLGAALISRYAWMLDLFAACLVVTGLSMLLLTVRRRARGRRWMVDLLRRGLRVTAAPHGARFFVIAPHPTTGWPVIWCTPLLLALMLILTADLVFAVDSVPAIFAISQDPFIVYSSNLFAILGLRALYFKIAALMARLRYMVYSLAVILVVIGGEVLLANVIGKIPPAWSLSMILALLAGGMLFSLWQTARERRAEYSSLRQSKRVQRSLSRAAHAQSAAGGRELTAAPKAFASQQRSKLGAGDYTYTSVVGAPSVTDENMHLFTTDALRDFLNSTVRNDVMWRAVAAELSKRAEREQERQYAEELSAATALNHAEERAIQILQMVKLILGLILLAMAIVLLCIVVKMDG